MPAEVPADSSFSTPSYLSAHQCKAGPRSGPPHTDLQCVFESMPDVDDYTTLCGKKSEFSTIKENGQKDSLKGEINKSGCY